VAPTDVGAQVLEQFRRVLQEYGRIEEILNQTKGQVSGDYRLGVIPTMASYIVPLFLRAFVKQYPKVHLSIHEITTDEIIHNLKAGQIDAGILATPLGDPQIIEEPLFAEGFCIYHSKDLDLGREGQAIGLKELPLDQIVVMNEGHCLRNQVLDLCKLSETSHAKNFVMETGSVATLIRIIDQGPYFTILPQLCLQDLPKKKLTQQVKMFIGATPYREVGMVTYRRELKRATAQALMSIIQQNIPESLKQMNSSQHKGRLILPV
jgi:LysR family hydrogen peroxide-inducible transcriptional activator